MALYIVTNPASLRARRNLSKVTQSLAKNIQRLSSGLRINSAADDPTGTAISSKLSANIKGLKQAERNTNDAVSLMQTADSALSEAHGLLSRMRELAVEASSSGTMDTTERGYLDDEFQLLESELDRIIDITEYNGLKLINGALSAGATFQVGMRNSTNDRLSVAITDTGSTDLGLNDDTIGLVANASTAITALDTAITSLATKRATIGATQNRLTVTLGVLRGAHEIHSIANSRIKDADIAEETAKFTQNQILSQAGIALLAQANALPYAVLALLG